MLLPHAVVLEFVPPFSSWETCLPAVLVLTLPPSHISNRLKLPAPSPPPSTFWAAWEPALFHRFLYYSVLAGHSRTDWKSVAVGRLSYLCSILSSVCEATVLWELLHRLLGKRSGASGTCCHETGRMGGQPLSCSTPRLVLTPIVIAWVMTSREFSPNLKFVYICISGDVDFIIG